MLNLFNRRQQTLTPESQAIKSLSYDPRRHSLLVTFANGSRYEYGCIDRDTYRDLSDSDSSGQFFHAHIRGLYPYCRR